MKRKEGFIYIDSDFVYDEKLSDSEKLMIGKIHGYCMSNNGQCFLTAAELGNQMTWDKRKAQRIVLELERRGYIVRECEGNETILRMSNAVSKNEGNIKGGNSDKNVAPQRQNCRPHSDKNVAPSDKIVAPSDKNVAPSDKNVAPFIYRTEIEEKLEENIEQNSDREKIITEEEKLFFSFWEAYPKKVDKKGSLRAFKNISHLKKVYPDIMRALSVQKNSRQWKEQNGRFIPNPTTYILQERWLSVNEAEEKEDISQKIAAEALKSWGWLKEGDGFDEQESFY